MYFENIFFRAKSNLLSSGSLISPSQQDFSIKTEILWGREGEEEDSLEAVV